jgi:Spy/CpxP family protein refolding chaperone
MQPSLNLKSFLAVLIILIVPAALLVAYFRNYSAEGGGHEHGDAAASGKGGDKSTKKPDHDMSAMKPGSGMSEMVKSSAMPGVPGVSRLYHIGATEFFLNHPEHITLTTKQQTALNRIKQKALPSKSTAQRKIEDAEQELWELTGADEPDASQIQVTVQAIEKLRGEQRMAFIQSVSEAAKVLTDEQRQMLLGSGANK